MMADSARFNVPERSGTLAVQNRNLALHENLSCAELIICLGAIIDIATFLTVSDLALPGG